MKHNLPKSRKIGKNIKRCVLCGRAGAHVSAFGLDLCRQCFRLNARKMGFKKYS